MYSFLDNYHELSANVLQYFSESSTTEKGHLVCVNYIPITSYSSNNTLYATIHKKSKSPIVLSMRHTPSGGIVLKDRFRSAILGVDSIIAKLSKLKGVDTRTSVDDLKRWLPLSETNIMSDTLSEVYRFRNEIYEGVHIYFNGVPELLRSIADSLEDSVAVSEELVSKVLSFVRQMEDSIRCALELPEDLLDLFAYIEYAYKSAPVKVSFVEELSAINILTGEFVKLEKAAASVGVQQQATPQRIAYDKHMLHANYAMLSAFVSNISSSRYSNATQQTFRVLSEYVPIAMKFSHIYNPLLDISPVTGISLWKYLSDNHSIIASALPVTNFCNYKGQKMDVADTEFNPDDSSTYHVSHIYYGMCCDFNSIFRSLSEESSVFLQAVIPKRAAWLPNAIVYTPHLAEAIIVKMLVDAAEFEAVSSQPQYLIFDRREEKDCYYEFSVPDLLEGNDLCEIVLVSNPAFEVSPAKSIETKRQEITYIESAILRCLVYSLSSKTVLLSGLRRALEQMVAALGAADLESIGNEWR